MEKTKPRNKKFVEFSYFQKRHLEFTRPSPNSILYKAINQIASSFKPAQ